MKKSALYLVAFLMTAFMGSAIAQDDVYYDPSDDYYQDTYTADASDAYADEDTYYRENDSNTCGYSYTSRVRRFRSSYSSFGYYDPCYTDSYYYGGAPGTNVYITYGSPYSYYNSSRPNNWNTWGNSPYGYSSYGGYGNPYAYNYGNGYNSYGGYGAYGNGYGYNSYGGYSNAYCPPSAYGGYYASSTPGNSNYSTPRPTRPNNYSTGNNTAGSTGVRPGTTSNGYDGDRPGLGKNQNEPSVFDIQAGEQVGGTNPRPGKDVIYPVDKPDQRPSTATAPRPTTKPAATTRSKPRTKPATTVKSIFNRKPASTTRSNNSSKPSYTPKRSSSSSRPSYKPSPSRSKSSASPSRRSSSPSKSSSSRRGGK